MPDERCRVLRRRLAWREQLEHSRSRAKNEIHAVLQRRLQGKPPCSDLFGVKGRRWLAALDLPVEERESVDAGIRHVEFVDSQIAAVERLIARQALAWPEISIGALSEPAMAGEATAPPPGGAQRALRTGPHCDRLRAVLHGPGVPWHTEAV
jgi:transposase